ncbi:MAG TPA: hypothetical protein VH309_00215, partial [Elusimicrobiota bacterium]|nr:hypothetical protein [Elusimicrobiota bacterium]
VTAPGHGFSDGDVIDIDSAVEGMDSWQDANGNAVPTPGDGEDTTLLVHKTVAANGYVVANETTDTFELTDGNGANVDGRALSSYAGGGNVRKQVTSVTGLDHLDGSTVAVLANGFVQSQKVVSAGAIALDVGASRVQAGLPYISDLETLSIEVPQQDGTIQGRKVKIPEVTLRLQDAAGGKIMQGEDARNLDDLTLVSKQDTPGKAQPLFTGDLTRVSVASGYDYGGRIWIRQDAPLPIAVLAIIPNVVVGG